MPPNDKVVLAEVNCREARDLAKIHQAGAGGWPTLKYFNKETGVAGLKYTQLTKDRVCEEMKKPEAVVKWIEDFGGFKVNLDAAKAEL
mmetsp:Transcript_41955/g.85683  ORF Transcript_41955/g.85683 Transcript_41955/m.85683 type:complete len:88 (-) Transcript_41955:316-579(-)